MSPERCAECGLGLDEPHHSGKCRHCRNAGQAVLYHDEQRSWMFLERYYGILNEDPEFESDLRRLYLGVGRYIPYCGPALMGMYAREVTGQLAAFAERWRLPRRSGLPDLWSSILLAAEGARLQLRAGGRALTGGPDTPTIQPPVPLAFDYDPRRRSRAWLQEYAQQMASLLVDSIMEQASRVEDELTAAGWERLPTEGQDAGDLRRPAHHLYRATRGEPWERIARDDGLPVRTVRTTTLRWARQLEIPLPAPEPAHAPAADPPAPTTRG